MMRILLHFESYFNIGPPNVSMLVLKYVVSPLLVTIAITIKYKVQGLKFETIIEPLQSF